MGQAKGPRRRRTGAGIGVIQPAYQSWVYFQASQSVGEMWSRWLNRALWAATSVAMTE